MIAIANGAGVDRAYPAAKMISDAAQIWNIGFAGAADPALGVGAVIVASCVHSGARVFRCEPPRARRPFRSGVVLTIPTVAQTAREKRNYYELGASVVEMEAAGVGKAASEACVPFRCVRAISDLAGEDLMNDYNRALGPDGKFRILRLLSGAFANPFSRLSELMRLEKRTSLAARNLGEFLADCEF